MKMFLLFGIFFINGFYRFLPFLLEEKLKMLLDLICFHTKTALFFNDMFINNNFQIDCDKLLRASILRNRS